MKRNLSSLIYHFLFAVSGSVLAAIVASWPLLVFFMMIQKTNEVVNMSVMKVMHNYNQLLFYLLWPFQNRLRMSNFHTSGGAAEHFYECKILFQIALLVFLVCLLIHYLAKKNRKMRYLRLNKTAALIFILLPVAVLPFAVTNFDSFFIAFHHIFFHNSNWLFNPQTDPIIDVLTDGFFASCFAVFGIVYELYFAKRLMAR